MAKRCASATGAPGAALEPQELIAVPKIYLRLYIYEMIMAIITKTHRSIHVISVLYRSFEIFQDNGYAAFRTRKSIGTVKEHCEL